MRSLAGLNPQQLEAVRKIDGHLLVVAGAGSGKTRVLTHKIAHLIENRGVRPSQVLAMTFSNKAAAEMRERIAHLLPSFEQPRWVGTFHSTCLKILKEFHAEANLARSFTIYDESDQLAAIKRALSDLGFDPKLINPKSIRYHIDRAKNETDRVVDHLIASGQLNDRAVEVVRRYEQILQQNQALDFGDLLTRLVRLLRNNAEIAKTIRSRWQRVLIDEYQDTNQIQKELVKMLIGTTGIVCAVGDEDQSIYGWRGARVENMMEFPHDFPGGEIVKLEQNYRSTRQILDVANNVIRHNVGRREKSLWTENNDGAKVIFYQAEDDHNEASYVMSRVNQLIQKGTPPNQIALFYRTHAQSRLLEDECRRHNQLYRVFGGIRFYDRSEIKDALAFLRLLLNP
jgi:DNA helicase-2/ATP-dependent DNA helicase PcrA